MKSPDGMANMATERKHMEAMRHEPRTPPWELAALDAEGNILYRTEYQESKEEAVEEAAALNSSDPSTPDLPEGVARFKPVRTEE